MRDLPNLTRFSLAVLVSTVAVYTPSVPFKVILLLASVVILSRNFSKGSVFFLVVSLVVLMVSTLGDLKLTSLWNFLEYNLPEGLSEGSEIEPDTRIESPKDLRLRIYKVKLVFDPSVNGIEYPSSLKLKRGEYLEIEGPWKDPRYYVVVVGSPPPNDIRIDCSGLRVSGSNETRFESLRISCVGVDMTGDLDVGFVRIESVGARISGSISAEEVLVSGSGVDVSSRLKAGRIEIDGAGVKLNMDVEGAEYISVESAGIDGVIRYVDDWSGTRELHLKGFGRVRVEKGEGDLRLFSERTFVSTVNKGDGRDR